MGVFLPRIPLARTPGAEESYICIYVYISRKGPNELERDFRIWAEEKKKRSLAHIGRLHTSKAPNLAQPTCLHTTDTPTFTKTYAHTLAEPWFPHTTTLLHNVPAPTPLRYCACYGELRLRCANDRTLFAAKLLAKILHLKLIDCFESLLRKRGVLNFPDKLRLWQIAQPLSFQASVKHPVYVCATSTFRPA